MRYRYVIYVDGFYTCGVEGTDLAQVIKETLRYVWLYQEDGVLTINGARGKNVTPLELMTLLERDTLEKRP